MASPVGQGTGGTPKGSNPSRQGKEEEGDGEQDEDEISAMEQRLGKPPPLAPAAADAQTSANDGAVTGGWLHL